MHDSVALPESIKAILREADAVLLKMAGESHHLLYHFLRTTASKIAHVDAFYIGFYYKGNRMAFPYLIDGQIHDDPNTNSYSDSSPAAWILQNRKPYWSKYDNAALLRRGNTFGDRTRRSEDAILVPILEPKSDRIIGVLSIQSYLPNSYDETTILALEWLANSVAIVFAREWEDDVRRRELGSTEGLETAPLRLDDIVNRMLQKMSSVRHKAEALRDLVPTSENALSEAVEELCRECQQRQTETIELFMRSVRAKENPLSPLTGLTVQERRIVHLLVEGYSAGKSGYTNRQVAEKLFITEDTVKTHLKAIYRKFGVSGRTGVVEIARPYVSEEIGILPDR